MNTNKFRRYKLFYYLCADNQLQPKQVEPPSLILKELNISADQNSDDPLSSNIYMIMGNASYEGQEALSVCAWSSRTGLLYIGTPDSTLS